MKQIYFERNENELRRKAIYYTTELAYSLIPGAIIKASYKILTNPYSKRDVSFIGVDFVANHLVESKLGNIKLYRFGEGERHILLTHGWADTSRSFSSMINYFVAEGYSVWSFDHIGHGESDGKVSHLFGFIDGLRNIYEFISDKYKIDAIIGHSMGGVALLNLSNELPNTKKVLMGSPVKFFEGMFETMDKIGISNKILYALLEDVSKEFGENWRELRPQNHQDILDEDFLIIHDENDEHCSFENMSKFISKSSARFYSTKNLGHRKILRNKAIHSHINEFLNA